MKGKGRRMKRTWTRGRRRRKVAEVISRSRKGMVRRRRRGSDRKWMMMWRRGMTEEEIGKGWKKNEG
jgi:hypothetical protein